MAKPKVKIALKNISKSFGKKTVLDKLSLDIMEGDSLVIMGGSGTGKSVLLKCILGLVKADHGSIKLNGDECFNLRGKSYEKFLTHFSMLFQGSALFDSITVWENVVFGLRQTKQMTNAEAQEIAIETIGSVGLNKEVAFSYPAELSGGMQRRVAIARAIVTKPEIIFFDEPTAGLDPIISNVINEMIVDCSKKLGATSVTITHDINSARKIAKNVAMIHGGKIIWAGPIEQMDKSGNDYVEQFIHGQTKGPIELQIKG
ncbi:MAG: ATP-binding cassette domain-containing protein [Alphaproteobacteria bacterium]|nr:ATP-binding cassette domain-containing protein [Alphaproteobacteria bacterium]OJV46472.1 MAG: ABC transporter ATP-binding protein [Alphaproteobacteria bacterium 43-37]